MRRVINNLRVETGWPLNIRIGIDSGGPVVAGVVGIKKFAYDVWGDTMNTASRMESHGVAGQIQVTEGAYERLRHAYDLEARGFISVKSKGDMRTYFLIGKQGERHG
jgi:class 3 adenylate cyclase